MNRYRSDHSATLLISGKVLVVGGNGNDNPTSAEIFAPSMGTWSFTGSMNEGRCVHTATLLNDYQILITGGLNGSILVSAEIGTSDFGILFLPLMSQNEIQD